MHKAATYYEKRVYYGYNPKKIGAPRWGANPYQPPNDLYLVCVEGCNLILEPLYIIITTIVLLLLLYEMARDGWRLGCWDVTMLPRYEIIRQWATQWALENNVQLSIILSL